MRRTIQTGLFVVIAGAAVAAQTPAPAAVTPAAGATAPAALPAPVTAAAPAPSATPVEAVESEVKAVGSAPAATGVAAPAQGYTYNAEGRRDPFVPLLKGSGKQALTTTTVARAAGLAGLSTADVTLRGVLVSQGAYVAMLHGIDEKTYIVRTGDKLADGTIRTITSEMMLIQQVVNDPLSRQKEREVRKMLRHSDGTN
jgi:Tfp pilus assembly protein PilP